MDDSNNVQLKKGQLVFKSNVQKRQWVRKDRHFNTFEHGESSHASKAHGDVQKDSANV